MLTVRHPVGHPFWENCCLAIAAQARLLRIAEAMVHRYCNFVYVRIMFMVTCKLYAQRLSFDVQMSYA